MGETNPTSEARVNLEISFCELVEVWNESLGAGRGFAVQGGTNMARILL
jgi:hypothetical protein